MDQNKIQTLFERFQQQSPNPQTELNFTNPFTLLVAVVLSAQATDRSVNKATATLFNQVQSPQDILDLGLEALKNSIKTIGLYNTKANNILRLSEILIQTYGGQVPRDRQALESLPGVGRKTANVVLNVAFHQDTIAVDTHIFRVCNRTGLSPGKTPLEVEQGLEKCVPPAFRLSAHHWLILHGRYVCIARQPKCPDCLINDLCSYAFKTPSKIEAKKILPQSYFFN